MILLRHGESEFNEHFALTGRDPGIIDARLTDLGRAQAAAAARELVGRKVRRIIVSPYTRALETAAPIAAALGAPVTVTTTVGERCVFTCDIGSPRTELQRAWPDIDFSHIDELWWPPMPEPADAVLARAARFRAEAAALIDWSDMLVVTHWGFVMSLTGRSVSNGRQMRFDPTAPAPREISWRP